MGFWQKLAKGFEIAGKVLAAFASLEVVGGFITLPVIQWNGVEGRDFDVVITVSRRK